MQKDESTIKSASVSLGSNVSAKSNPLEKNRPRGILICGDFGFYSAEPTIISSSTIQEFIDVAKPKIALSVTNNLPSLVDSFFAEWEIRSFNDFSPETISSKIPLLKEIITSKQILEKIIYQKQSAQNGYEQIDTLQIPGKLKEAILSSLGQAAPAKNAKIDSILSMLDVEPEQEKVTDQFISDIANGNESINTNTISNNIILLESIVSQLIDLIVEHPAYKELKTNWHALKNLCKKIGRTKDIFVLLSSSPPEIADNSLENAMQACVSEGLIPDLILWNYRVTFSTSSIDLLKQPSVIADKYKSVLITSIHHSEPMLTQLGKIENTRDFFNQPDLIAYNRLRKEIFSRCLSICAPSYIINTPEKALLSGGGWLLCEQWISSILNGGSPFDFSSTSNLELPDDNILQPNIDSHAQNGAAENGLTLLRTRSGRVFSSPRVLLATDGSFCSLGFNLLVNSVMRSSVALLSSWSKEYSISEAAHMLQNSIYSELKISEEISSDAISVSIESESVLKIVCNSDKTIDQFSLQFEFSLNY
jgi:hypothetical protein